MGKAYQNCSYCGTEVEFKDDVTSVECEFCGRVVDKDISSKEDKMISAILSAEKKSQKQVDEPEKKSDTEEELSEVERIAEATKKLDTLINTMNVAEPVKKMIKPSFLTIVIVGIVLVILSIYTIISLVKFSSMNDSLMHKAFDYQPEAIEETNVNSDE